MGIHNYFLCSYVSKVSIVSYSGTLDTLDTIDTGVAEMIFEA